MISFFRLNDPYRIIGIFILLLIIRLPAWLGLVPLLQPELGWMLLGENIAAGDTLYIGVWDDIGPLSAMVYWLVDFLFGRSQLAYYLLSVLLVVVQAYIFNTTLIRYKAYNESTFVPSLFYMLLANIFYDFYTLSPVLLCLTFLVPALRNLFRQIVGIGSDETILFLGLYTGLAGLFYLQSISLLVAFIFSLLIFTGTKPRQYLLLMVGFMLPLAAFMLYYSWQYGLDSLYWQYIGSFELLPEDNYLNIPSLVLVALIPILFLLIGIYRYNNSHAFNNYQVRLQQSLFYYLLMGIVAILFSPEKSAFHFMLLLPPLSFYISQYFMLFRRRLKAELYFLGFVVLLLGLNYYLLADAVPYVSDYTNFEELEVEERPEQELVEGKEILFLGHDLSLYREARLATPYLDWTLSEEQFTSLNYYQNLLAVYRNLSLESPQVIVDDVGLMPAVFDRMPILKSKYRPADRYPHVYILENEEDN